MRKHTRRFIFFQKLLGRVQFHFQSETEQSFLYDFRFLFILWCSVSTLTSFQCFLQDTKLGWNLIFVFRKTKSISTNDTNYVRFISNLQRFPKPLELIRRFWYYRPKSLMSQLPFIQHSHFVPVLSLGHSTVVWHT